MEWGDWHVVLCGVNISNSVTRICTYGLQLLNKSNYQSEPRPYSLIHVTVRTCSMANIPSLLPLGKSESPIGPPRSFNELCHIYKLRRKVHIKLR
jgi:hypothetical protein